MNPHTHFLVPFFVASILERIDILNWKLVILCGFIGAFVDIDHYFEHILHAKSNRFSLFATWNNSMKLHRFNQRSFIHNFTGVLIIGMLLLLLAVYEYKTSLAIGIGYYSHLLLDHIWVNKSHWFRFRIFGLYFMENNFEFILDLISILGILVIILL